MPVQFDFGSGGALSKATVRRNRRELSDRAAGEVAAEGTDAFDQAKAGAEAQFDRLFGHGIRRRRYLLTLMMLGLQRPDLVARGQAELHRILMSSLDQDTKFEALMDCLRQIEATPVVQEAAE